MRFSTVAGGRGSADAVRDPRGFAVKFYTEDGNYDLTGNNTPIFFIRDPLKFPDFIHSQKPDPFTNHQEPDNVWDFFSHSPEATHMFTWLFGDRGIPASYRHMDGFGSHTFQWVNADGQAVWVKYHFKTDQGIRCLDSSEAAELAGLNPDSHQLDLIEAIERGDFPSWTLSVQVMTPEEAAASPVNPFDLTKVWSQKEYPLHEVGRLTLNRNADNYFGDVEQAGFDPGNFVPGIGPSPDKMLQGRLFAYGDAHRYRLGINHTQLPVNAPHAAEARNYGRDGLMAGHGNGGRADNYEPNSFDGPVETGRALRCSARGGRPHRHVRVGPPGDRRLQPGRGSLPAATGRRPDPPGRQHRRRPRIGVVRPGRRRHRRAQHRPVPGGRPRVRRADRPGRERASRLTCPRPAAPEPLPW